MRSIVPSSVRRRNSATSRCHTMACIPIMCSRTICAIGMSGKTTFAFCVRRTNRTGCGIGSRAHVRSDAAEGAQGADSRSGQGESRQDLAKVVGRTAGTLLRIVPGAQPALPETLEDDALVVFFAPRPFPGAPFPSRWIKGAFQKDDGPPVPVLVDGGARSLWTQQRPEPFPEALGGRRADVGPGWACGWCVHSL